MNTSLYCNRETLGYRCGFSYMLQSKELTALASSIQQLRYFSGVVLNTTEISVKTRAASRAASTHCIVNHVCFVLHCFIWFSSKSKRRCHLKKPKMLFLFISKPELALCGQVYFKGLPKNPLLLKFPGNRVPMLSSKNR